ncbi:MAG: DNA repair protein RecO [Butyrivibrio sp.]|nr:DNA repair protein RecO [Butyrivibrio sp.]
MEDIITVRGIVLKHSPSGDYDWVATIFTRERGKITAFARSARKPVAKLSGSVEPFCFGTFKMFATKNSYTIVEADIENYFEGFRTDLEGACYGTFFLELASYYTRENNEDVELLNLLYLSLKALLKESIPNKLVRCIFELRALQTEGEYPGVPEDMALSQAAVYAMEHISASPLEKLYTFNVTTDVLSELCRVCRKYRKRFIDRTLKSTDMLATFDDAL